jgi:hypothetical protein
MEMACVGSAAPMRTPTATLNRWTSAVATVIEQIPLKFGEKIRTFAAGSGLF